MTEHIWMAGPPGKVVVATDLSARSDRALERAAQLAKQWQAELVAVSVLESFATAPDLLAMWVLGEEGEISRIAREQLIRDVAGLDVEASVRIVRGNDTADAIRDLAAEIEPGIVITGLARNESMGRLLLGSTVKRLARTIPQPLLVVHNRVHSAYRLVLVATDFSEPSRHALQAAARLFTDCEIILYHGTGLQGHEHPDALSGLSFPGAEEEIRTGKCAEFLAASDLPRGARERLRIVIQHGRLSLSMTQYVRQHQVDLAVLGTQGRSWLPSVLLGSTTAELLDWLPCDTMTVRAPRANA